MSSDRSDVQFSSLAVGAAATPDDRVSFCAVIISVFSVHHFVRPKDGLRSWRRKIQLADETMDRFNLTENCDLFNSVEHKIVFIQKCLVTKFSGIVGLTTNEATRIRFTSPHSRTSELN